MFYIIIAGIIGLIVTLLWWRYSSVARGARQRDERVLTAILPVTEKLARGEQPSSAEVEAVGKKPHARLLLYQGLKHYEQLDLFPAEYRTEEAQAAGILAYWMMHPNELQDAPEEIELVEKVDRDIADEKCRFYVFRYRMPIGHWAGQDWLLGVCGPFIDHEPPYSGLCGAFSRCGDKFGEIQPSELVNWYIGMCR